MYRIGLLSFFGFISFFVISNIFFTIISAVNNDKVARSKDINTLILLIFLQVVITFAFYFVYKNHNELFEGFVNTAIIFIKANRNWFIFSLVATFIGFISMGAPGFLFLTLFDGLTTLVNNIFPLSLKTFSQKYHGDNTWPTAIMISLAWPWLLLILNKLFTNYTFLTSGVTSILMSFLTLFLLLFTRC